MASVENAVLQIDKATGFANDSGHALTDIVSTAEATADQIQAIAAASEQQSAASEEINANIERVNNMVGQTAESMAEAAGPWPGSRPRRGACGALVARMQQQRAPSCSLTPSARSRRRPAYPRQAILPHSPAHTVIGRGKHKICNT